MGRSSTGTATSVSSVTVTGGATSAKQDTGNTSLASIDTKLTNPLPVSLSSAPLATNAAQETGGNLATIAGKDFATQTTLAAIKAKTDNLDVLLSTRTKPADAQHVIVDSGVTTGLTDTQLRATPVPVSGTITISNPTTNPETGLAKDVTLGSLTETAPTTDIASSGLNGRLQRIAQRLTSLISALGSPFQAGGSIGNTSFQATQATGTNLHVVVDSAPTTAVTGPITDTQIRATPLPVSGTVTANTGLTQPLTDTQLRATAVPVSGTVNPTTPTTLIAFVTAVTTAGTRVQLGSNSVVAGIVQAPSTNTGIIYVGGSTVSSTVYGAELQAGQASGIAIDNTNKIYIDSSANGDKCAFLGS